MTRPTLNDRGCPFCGSKNLKASSRQAGGANRHYICQVFCLNCGARGPMVKSIKMDYRDVLTGDMELDLALKAYRRFYREEEPLPEDDLFAGKEKSND